jgi:hypothetical protein
VENATAEESQVLLSRVLEVFAHPFDRNEWF